MFSNHFRSKRACSMFRFSQQYWKQFSYSAMCLRKTQREYREYYAMNIVLSRSLLCTASHIGTLYMSDSFPTLCQALFILSQFFKQHFCLRTEVLPWIDDIPFRVLQKEITSAAALRRQTEPQHVFHFLTVNGPFSWSAIWSIWA